ncbi:MAG: penicillin-binding protein activator [Nitrospirota bacterium]
MNRINHKPASAVIVIISIIITSAMFFSFGCTKKEEKEIKIGAILPLTGDAGVYGQAIKKGMDLALEEIMKQVRMTKLHVIYEDDQGNPATSVSALNKLTSTDKVRIIIGGAMSSTAEPIIPITEKEKIILLSPTATKATLTNNTKYFFRLWPSDNYDGQVMANVAYKNLGLRRVAILFVDAAYGQGIADVFKREFEKLGGSIVGYESYAQGATDLRSQLVKIRGTRPEAVYIPGYVKEVSILLRQARELGFKTRFLGVNSLNDPALLELAGQGAEGAVFTYPTYDKSSSDRVIQEFVQAFKSKYGTEPDVFAAQGYDSLHVLVRAIELGGGSSVDQIRNGFFMVKDYEGPGGKVTFEHNGDVVKPLRLLTVHDGRFVDFK